MNQLATPGLGSLMGGRIVAGSGQLALALAGFGLLLGWFFKVISGYYGMITDQLSAPESHAAWGIAGAAVFGAAWCWSLVTSFSLINEGRRNARKNWNHEKTDRG